MADLLTPPKSPLASASRTRRKSMLAPSSLRRPSFIQPMGQGPRWAKQLGPPVRTYFTEASIDVVRFLDPLDPEEAQGPRLHRFGKPYTRRKSPPSTRRHSFSGPSLARPPTMVPLTVDEPAPPDRSRSPRDERSPSVRPPRELRSPKAPVQRDLRPTEPREARERGTSAPVPRDIRRQDDPGKEVQEVREARTTEPPDVREPEPKPTGRKERDDGRDVQREPRPSRSERTPETTEVPETTKSPKARETTKAPETDPPQKPPTARPGTTKSGPGVQEPSPEPRVTGEEREEPVHVEPERDAPQHHEPRDDESEAPEPTRRTRSLTTFVPRKSDPSRPRSLTTHLDTSPFAREHTPTERDEDPRVSLFTASRLLSVVNGPTSTATFLEAPEETPETPGGPRTTALERAGRTKRERSGAVTRRDGHRNREEIDETDETEEVDETGEDTPKRRERGPGLVQRVRKGLRALSLGRAMRRKAAGMQERIRERGAERRRQEVAQRVERELTEQTRQREEQAERTRTLQRLQDDHDRRRKKKAPVDETTGDVETPEHPKDTRKPEVEEPGRPTPTTSEASPKEPEPREDRDEAPEDAPEAGRKPGKRPLDPEIGKLVDRMMELVAPTSLNQEARQLLVRGAMATLKASSSGEMVTLDGETDEDDTEKPTGRASEKVARSRQTLRDDHAKLIKDRPLSQKKKELADVELLLKTEEGRQLVEDELRARKKEPELPLTKEEERDRKREIRRIQRVQKALGLTDTQLDEVEDLTPMAKGVRLQREMARGYVPKGAAPKGHDRGLAAESLLRAHPELRTITGSDGAPVFLEAPETDDTTTDTEAPTAKKGGYVPKGRAPEGYDREAVRSRLRASSRLSATPEVREDVSTDEDAPKTRKRANALVGGEGVRKVTSPTEQVGLSAPEDTGTEAPRPRSTGRRNPMARGPRQATALNRPIRWVEKQLGRPGAWGRSKVDALTAWTVGEKKVLNRRPGGVVPVTGQGEQTHLSVPETAPTGVVPHSTVRQRAEADQKQRDAESEGLRERRDREKDQKEQRKAKKFGWTAPKELIRRHQRALQEKVEERSAEREGRTAKHHRKPGAGALKARRAPIELADEEQLLKALRALVDRSPEAMDLLDRVHQELVELDHLEGLRRR